MSLVTCGFYLRMTWIPSYLHTITAILSACSSCTGSLGGRYFATGDPESATRQVIQIESLLYDARHSKSVPSSQFRLARRFVASRSSVCASFMELQTPSIPTSSLLSTYITIITSVLTAGYQRLERHRNSAPRTFTQTRLIVIA